MAEQRCRKPRGAGDLLDETRRGAASEEVRIDGAAEESLRHQHDPAIDGMGAQGLALEAEPEHVGIFYRTKARAHPVEIGGEIGGDMARQQVVEALPVLGLLLIDPEGPPVALAAQVGIGAFLTRSRATLNARS